VAGKGGGGPRFFHVLCRACPKPVAAKWNLASDVIDCLFTGPRLAWKDAVQNNFFDALAASNQAASNFEGFQLIVVRDADIGVIMDPKSTDQCAVPPVALIRTQAWMAGGSQS